jgi:uncharacterized membrane protein YkoI
MKKLLFAFAFMSFGSVAVMAQDSTSVSPQTPPASTEVQGAQDQSGDQGQAVTASELPAAIQTALQGQDYSGWTVANAMKKEKDGKTVYAVELKNGAETKKVKFDADGTMLKEKDKE